MKYFHIRYFLFLIAAVLLAGCNIDSLNTSAPEFLQIEIDRDEYLLDEVEFIAVSITNISNRTIHYNSCLPAHIDVLDDENNIAASIPVPKCECRCLTTLEPGETILPGITRIPVFASTVFHEMLTGYVGSQFRIRYEFSLDANWNQILPPSLADTPVFTITKYDYYTTE